MYTPDRPADLNWLAGLYVSLGYVGYKEGRPADCSYMAEQELVALAPVLNR